MSFIVRESSPIKLTGLSIMTYPLGHPKNNPMLIPDLWSNLMQEISRNAIEFSGPMYGAMKMQGEEMFYLAGFASNVEHPGFESIEVPAQKYIVFEHRGSLQFLGETMHNIFSKEFPNSGLKGCDGISLEIYDERFVPESTESIFEIAFPVS